MTVALIDADSMYYILAWQFRERLAPLIESGAMLPGEKISLDTELAADMFGAVDQFVIGILQACGATHYLGAIGDKQRCFRYEVAKFKPYKGKRGTPEPWFLLWKPVIEERLRTEWGFVSVPGLEADDIIALSHEQENKRTVHELGETYPIDVVVCSPDKDMRQLTGRHFDYKKLDFADVDQDQADYNLAFQMIAGDTSDGVAGIPGAGEKKAKEKLKEGKESGLFYDQVVRAMYYKHFGDHYGKIIYNENMAVLSLVTSTHPFHGIYTDFRTKALELRPVPEGVGTDTATLDTLKSLGWG